MTAKKKQDNVGENIVARNASWRFSGDVPKTFSQHIRRSVPFYTEGHDLVCKISDFFLHENGVCYELGVATGTLILELAKHHEHRQGMRFVGIDLEKEMIGQARKYIGKRPNIELAVGDISRYPLKKCDLIVAYYTMQFVPPHERQKVFNKIYTSLHPGGGFLLFEKVRAPDARFQDMMQSLYVDFKLEQQFTGNEIVAKSRSLKGVLEPRSSQGNLGMIKKAGFTNVMSVFKYVCFEGYLAIK